MDDPILHISATEGRQSGHELQKPDSQTLHFSPSFPNLCLALKREQKNCLVLLSFSFSTFYKGRDASHFSKTPPAVRPFTLEKRFVFNPFNSFMKEFYYPYILHNKIRTPIPSFIIHLTRLTFA